MSDYINVKPMEPFSVEVKCCHCLQDSRTTNGFVYLYFLNRRAPVAGTGWGCCKCKVPQNGAIAILCQDCHTAGKPILFICFGLAVHNARIPIESLPEVVFDHDVLNHPEFFKNDDVLECDPEILESVNGLIDKAKARSLHTNARWN